MSAGLRWWRSVDPPPRVAPSWKRVLRNRVQSLLPERDVRGRPVVIEPRHTLPQLTRLSLQSEFHGLFSEFHSVLGALVYARTHGSPAVRVDYREGAYVEPERGGNWWEYFFESARMTLDPQRDDPSAEVRLNGRIDKYGRHGGFSDIVQGRTPYLYPLTYGLSRRDLHGLIAAHITVRSEILDEVQKLLAALFEPGAFVVGVHYRGTDMTRGWTGAFAHYRSAPVPYEAYVAETRRVIGLAAPNRFQAFVATDESDFLSRMRDEFGDRVVAYDGSPRAATGSPGVHLDRTLRVSPYQKGRSALVDALLLSKTDYLVKGRSNLSDASLAFNPDLPYSFWADVAVS
jgi:hypothetical protein